MPGGARRTISRCCARRSTGRRSDPGAARPARRGGARGRAPQARAAGLVPRPAARACGAGAADRARRSAPSRARPCGPCSARSCRPACRWRARSSCRTRDRRRRSATSRARPGSGCRRCYVPAASLGDVFREVGRGADYGVVPVEEASEGLVTHALDHFIDSDLLIVGEIVIEATHALLTHSGTTAGVAARVRAPGRGGALRGGAGRGGPRGGDGRATSAAAAAALARDDARGAALAPALAATLFDLAVAKPRLDDGPADVARFLVLGREAAAGVGRRRDQPAGGPGRQARAAGRRAQPAGRSRRQPAPHRLAPHRPARAARPVLHRSRRASGQSRLRGGARAARRCRCRCSRCWARIRATIGSRDAVSTQRRWSGAVARPHGRHRRGADRRLGGARRARRGRGHRGGRLEPHAREAGARAVAGHHRSHRAVGGRGGARRRAGRAGDAGAQPGRRRARRSRPSWTRRRWCSTSAASRRAAIAAVEPKLRPGAFVACHPVAGTERVGPDAASPLLFEGKRCVICPTRVEPRGGGRRSSSGCGRRWAPSRCAWTPSCTTACSARAATCRTSRAYALAAALGHLAPDVIEGLRRLPTSSLRDTTRVAASSPVMWRDILLDNRAEVLPLIEALARRHRGAARRGGGGRRRPHRAAAGRGQGRAATASSPADAHAASDRARAGAGAAAAGGVRRVGRAAGAAARRPDARTAADDSDPWNLVPAAADAVADVDLGGAARVALVARAGAGRARRRARGAARQLRLRRVQRRRPRAVRGDRVRRREPRCWASRAGASTPAGSRRRSRRRHARRHPRGLAWQHGVAVAGDARSRS